jgi:hypothetical protein
MVTDAAPERRRPVKAAETPAGAISSPAGTSPYPDKTNAPRAAGEEKSTAAERQRRRRRLRREGRVLVQITVHKKHMTHLLRSVGAIPVDSQPSQADIQCALQAEIDDWVAGWAVTA